MQKVRRYRDIEVDYWGQVFTRLHLNRMGVTFEAFIAAPMDALERAKDDGGWAAWAQAHYASATGIAKLAVSHGAMAGDQSEKRHAGDREHARHDAAVRRFQAVANA